MRRKKGEPVVVVVVFGESHGQTDNQADETEQDQEQYQTYPLPAAPSGDELFIPQLRELLMLDPFRVVRGPAAALGVVK